MQVWCYFSLNSCNDFFSADNKLLSALEKLLHDSSLYSPTCIKQAPKA